jgi:DNA-binding FadR family transcriptional regulator
MNHGRDRSLVMRVVDRLVAGIVSGEYRDNLLPPQDVLSKQFDVSRTVMREALSMLITRNMLDVRPKTGTKVRPMREWQMVDDEVVEWRFKAKPDPEFLRDLVEFRTLIEPRAASLAAMHASAAERTEIRNAFDIYTRATPGEPGFLEADEALHTAIVKASGNQFLAQMAAIVRAALSVVNPVITPTAVEISRETHERVVEAIEAHDAEAAEAAMASLISHRADEGKRDTGSTPPGAHSAAH